VPRPHNCAGKSWTVEKYSENYFCAEISGVALAPRFENWWLVWRVVLLLEHAGRHYNREGGSERIAATFRVWG
jgi:hypothetical protein